MKEINELNMAEISQRLREAKFVRKLSNQEIAVHGNTSHQTIKSMINGDVKKPNMVILSNIAKGLDIDPEWLFYGTGKKMDSIPTIKEETFEKPENKYLMDILKGIEQVNANLINQNNEMSKTIQHQSRTIEMLVQKQLGLAGNFKLVTEEKPPVQEGFRKVYKLPYLFAATEESHTKKEGQLQSA